MKVCPSVAEWTEAERKGHQSNGDVWFRVLTKCATIGEASKEAIVELSTRIMNPTIHQGSIKARVHILFNNKHSWARISAKGISQKDIDYQRIFFPNVIPGHDAINKAKV
jgi:hypothetical protein